MGMGYAANYADVIATEKVKELCPKEYNAFMEAISKSDISLEEFAIDYGNIAPEVSEKIVDCWNALYTEFERVTNLELRIDHHSKDDGDRYDDVDGVFFTVEGMYELTPAGKAISDLVERKFYVTYG